MITDPVSDFLTRIRNAAAVRAREVVVPYSRQKHEIALLLGREGYLEDVKREGKSLCILLAYSHRQPKVTAIRTVSKPGLRIYRKARKLPAPLAGAGISIVSTSQGIMSNRQARKKGLGGEVLGEVW